MKPDTQTKREREWRERERAPIPRHANGGLVLKSRDKPRATRSAATKQKQTKPRHGRERRGHRGLLNAALHCRSTTDTNRKTRKPLEQPSRVTSPRTLASDNNDENTTKTETLDSDWAKLRCPGVACSLAAWPKQHKRESPQTPTRAYENPKQKSRNTGGKPCQTNHNEHSKQPFRKPGPASRIQDTPTTARSKNTVSMVILRDDWREKDEKKNKKKEERRKRDRERERD